MRGFTFNPAATPRGSGYIAVPANTEALVPMYCSTPTVVVRPSLMGIPAPDMPCNQFIQMTLAGTFAPLTPWSN